MTDTKKTQTFLEAYLALQQELAPIGKDAKAYNYKYATLGAVKETVDPVLYKHGFVVQQSTKSNGHNLLLTRLIHVPTGESVDSDWELKPVKEDPQGMGSALTYGRRYQYMTVCNLVAEDDDGASASTAPDKKTVEGAKYQSKGNDADNRPWLTEAQFNAMLGKINGGEWELVQERMEAYKMKTVYRKTLNDAIEKHKPDMEDEVMESMHREELTQDVDPNDLPF